MLIVFSLALFSCEDKEQTPEGELPSTSQLREIPQAHQFFTENFKSYVQDRYGEDVKMVEADSLTGKVIFAEKDNDFSEIFPDIQMFLAKSPVDFFLLVNGLYVLDIKIETKSGKTYSLKIKKSEYEDFWDTRFYNLGDSKKLNDFLSNSFTKDKVQEFNDEMVK